MKTTITILVCDKCELQEWNLKREGEFHTARDLGNGKAARGLAHNGEITCDGILRKESYESPKSPKEPQMALSKKVKRA